MDLVLRHYSKREAGIFGIIDTETRFYTLEHAFPVPDNGYLPTIPNGTYTCVRGKHRLEHMTEDFETFEITGVQGHSKLLFHWGNWNKDSDGCILLGDSLADDMILHSKVAFAHFMALQEGLDSFVLTVGD